VIELRSMQSRRNETRPLRTVVTSSPLTDGTRRLDLSVRFRFVGKTSDPSFSEKPGLFRSAILPLKVGQDGFLLVAARDSQLVYWNGQNLRFTRFMNDILTVRPSVVTLINPKQKKPHLIADAHLSREGTLSFLDAEGNSLGHLSEGTQQPVVIHSDLLSGFPCAKRAIVRVELSLSQA